MPEKNHHHGLTISTTQLNRMWNSLPPTKEWSGVNQNDRSNALVRRVQDMGNLVKRTEVIAQILSPTGRVHMHDDPTMHLSCFPQSVCWRFPEKVE